MPNYDFLCDCGHLQTGMYLMSAVPEQETCEACGGAARRQLGAGFTMTRNSGNPDRQRNLSRERTFATISAQSPGRRLGVDPRDGIVRRGKRPREKRKIRVTVP